MTRASEPSAELARRLRQLRLQHWPHAELTQSRLAEALGVATSSVSSWENQTGGKIPPQHRLRDYATFFATARSVEGTRPHLLEETDLTEEERAERDRLERQLLQLCAASSAEKAPLPNFWRFADGGPVRVICGKLPDEDVPPYASAMSYNYIQLSAYADLDAMVELYGHIRSLNPDSDVRFVLPERLRSDDLQAHLVLLGSEAMNQATIFLTGFLTGQRPSQLHQVKTRELADGEIFCLRKDPTVRFEPVFTEDQEPQLVEDVGLLRREPSPVNSARSLTHCSGVFTRGVYGAVRCLTDPVAHFANNEYLQTRFRDEESFELLMRVGVLDRATATPDLTNPGTRLFEWPDAA